MHPINERQTAEINLSMRETSGLRMSVDVTPVGLLAITALVSGILLSTTLLVRTSIRESKLLPGKGSNKDKG